MSSPSPPVAVSDEALQRAEQYVEEEEGAANKLKGWLGAFVRLAAFVMAAFHLYTAYAIVQAQVLRLVHVAFVLFLCFLVFPVARRFRHRVMWWDWLAAALAIAIVVYAIQGGDDFTDRNTSPLPWDIAFGVGLILLVLEAMRRTSGWVMPVVTFAFLVYAMAGPWLPAPWTHKGYELGRLVGVMYMTLEGIFGVAVDVASSLIILFTIYGAFLQFSGAGKFYLDFSFAAMGGKPTGAGRTVVLASFLLGGPSGSGVATTVTLGAVAYPLLEKVGYEKNAAGGLLAAGGLGAIISPPVLGAAAFLIAEFLKISYLDVLLMAVIPTLLFYFALFLMVEIDARKYGMREIDVREGRERLGAEPALLVPLPLAGLDRRLHALGLLAGALGVLGDGGGAGDQHAAPRHRADPLGPVPRQGLGEGAPAATRASPRRWKAARSACSTSAPPAPAPASSSASSR